MSDYVAKKTFSSILVPLRLFLSDFSHFAGVKGVKALVFVLLGAVVEGVGLVLLIPFISVIIDSQNGTSWVQGAATLVFETFSAESRLARLSLIVAIFAALMAGRCVIITVRDVTMAQLDIGFIQHVRCRVSERLAATRWDAVSRLRYNRIAHLMSADIQRFDSATNIFLHDTVAVVMLASQTTLAFILAPQLTALALGVVLVGAVSLLPMISHARKLGSFATDAYLSLLEETTHFLGALKLAISQNLQDSFSRKFKETLCELKSQQVNYVRQQTIARLVLTALSGIVGAMFILLGSAVFDISSSVLITLLLILSRMSGPVMTLQVDAQQIANALPAYEKIRELENELIGAAVSCDVLSGTTADLSVGRIIFRGVSYLHETAKGAAGVTRGVRDLNLIIESGTIIGITGPSGAGKTTFADLLVGLYPPQSGEIFVGGVALHGPSVTAWRNLVSYVAQDPFLFHDTIRRNLLWANAEADEAAIWGVLQMTGADHLVRNAKSGLDTVVGERGSLLSGGERQRLCLARAMLRRPRLLILDEATSSIDIQGEQVLLDRIFETMPRPTIVMIAHRRESLSRCQRVLCLEDGRIISD